MQTPATFCLCFTEINTKLFSGPPKLPLIQKVSPLVKIKKSFLRLSVWDDEPLPSPKITTFLTESLPNFDQMMLHSHCTPIYFY